KDDINNKNNIDVKKKRSICFFIFNIIAVLVCTGAVMHFSPAIAPRLLGFNENAAAAFAPAEFVKENKENSSDNSDKTAKSDNTTNTASKENTTSASSDKDIDKDSDVYSGITETPDDIAKLMAEAEKTIKSEKQTGKTSEEDYFGGGTLVSFNGVEVQSKIPDSFYKLNIESLLNQKAELSIKDVSKPTVLVYHSHTTESYTLLDVGYYTKSLDPRSDSKAKNMVRVGDDLCEYLEAMGISVIHDRTIHDTNYNTAYDSSRKAVEKYLEKYPTIEITIDVHRDDITYKDKTKVKPTAVINNKKAARMMIIAGAQYGSIENYPDWEYNLRFDLAVQQKVNEMYPGLMRPVLFSQRKYNMDETRNSFLLEIGTDANTLDEACYSARLFATALAELIKEDYVEK
ncbi:MAG: stage II sporulation protein P, partial [Eubacterium sp.]